MIFYKIDRLWSQTAVLTSSLWNAWHSNGGRPFLPAQVATVARCFFFFNLGLELPVLNFAHHCMTYSWRSRLLGTGWTLREPYSQFNFLNNYMLSFQILFFTIQLILSINDLIIGYFICFGKLLLTWYMTVRLLLSLGNMPPYKSLLYVRLPKFWHTLYVIEHTYQ